MEMPQFSKHIFRRCLWIVWAVSWLCFLIMVLFNLPAAQLLHCTDGSTPPWSCPPSLHPNCFTTLMDPLAPFCPRWFTALHPSDPRVSFPHPYYYICFLRDFLLSLIFVPSWFPVPATLQPRCTLLRYPSHLLSPSGWHYLWRSLCGRSSLLCTLAYISTSLTA